MLNVQTLDDLWEAYENYSNTSIKQKKLDEYLWRTYLQPSFGTKRPEGIKNLDILLFQRKLLQKLSPQTTLHTLSLLRRIFNKSRMWDIYQGEIPLFEMPKFDNRRVRFLAPGEADLLFSILSSHS